MCLCHELQILQVSFENQATLSINDGGELIETVLRLDLWVGRRVVVELKAVEQLLPIHEAQLFTYLKLTKCRLGLLLNFNVRQFKHGFKRIVK